jgi:PAS domain-containing protein
MKGNSSRKEIDLTEMFNPIWDKSHVGLAVLDKHLCYQSVNSSLAEINGLPPELHLGRTLAEILGDVAAKIEPVLWHVMSSGRPVLNVEVSGTLPARATGKRWVGNYFPVANSDGEVTQIAALVVEVEDDQQPWAGMGTLTDVREWVPNRDVLRSWKDIANYLGTCVKTVQRWEECYGLPVRRLAASKGSVVFAFRVELDSWTQSKTVETKRGNTHERMMGIFASFPVPALVINDDRIIIEANDGAISLVRAQRHELIGKNLFAHLASGSTPTYNDCEWKFFQRAGISAGARNLRRADGSLFSAEYIMKRVANGLHLITFITVHTRLRRREAIFYEADREAVGLSPRELSAGI